MFHLDGAFSSSSWAQLVVELSKTPSFTLVCTTLFSIPPYDVDRSLGFRVTPAIADVPVIVQKTLSVCSSEAAPFDQVVNEEPSIFHLSFDDLSTLVNTLTVANTYQQSEERVEAVADLASVDVEEYAKDDKASFSLCPVTETGVVVETKTSEVEFVAQIKTAPQESVPTLDEATSILHLSFDDLSTLVDSLTVPNIYGQSNECVEVAVELATVEVEEDAEAPSPQEVLPLDVSEVLVLQKDSEDSIRVEDDVDILFTLSTEEDGEAPFPLGAVFALLTASECFLLEVEDTLAVDDTPIDLSPVSVEEHTGVLHPLIAVYDLLGASQFLSLFEHPEEGGESAPSVIDVAGQVVEVPSPLGAEYDLLGPSELLRLLDDAEYEAGQIKVDVQTQVNTLSDADSTWLILNLSQEILEEIIVDVNTPFPLDAVLALAGISEVLRLICAVAPLSDVSISPSPDDAVIEVAASSVLRSTQESVTDDSALLEPLGTCIESHIADDSFLQVSETSFLTESLDVTLVYEPSEPPKVVDIVDTEPLKADFPAVAAPLCIPGSWALSLATSVVTSSGDISTNTVDFALSENDVISIRRVGDKVVFSVEPSTIIRHESVVSHVPAVVEPELPAFSPEIVLPSAPAEDGSGEGWTVVQRKQRKSAPRSTTRVVNKSRTPNATQSKNRRTSIGRPATSAQRGWVVPAPEKQPAVKSTTISSTEEVTSGLPATEEKLADEDTPTAGPSQAPSDPRVNGEPVKKKNKRGCRGGQKTRLALKEKKKEEKLEREADHATELERAGKYLATFADIPGNVTFRSSGPWLILEATPETLAPTYPVETAKKFPALPLSTELPRSRFRNWYRIRTTRYAQSTKNYLTHDLIPTTRNDGRIPSTVREMHARTKAAEDRKDEDLYTDYLVPVSSTKQRFSLHRHLQAVLSANNSSNLSISESRTASSAPSASIPLTSSPNPASPAPSSSRTVPAHTKTRAPRCNAQDTPRTTSNATVPNTRTSTTSTHPHPIATTSATATIYLTSGSSPSTSSRAAASRTLRGILARRVAATTTA